MKLDQRIKPISYLKARSWRSASMSLDLRTLRGLGTSFFKGIDWIMGVLLME